MRRLLAFLAATALAAACARSTEPIVRPEPEPGPAPGNRGVDTVFVDEFDGAAIDRTKWHVYTGQVFNSEVQEYVDDTATMRTVTGAEAEGASGGALLIHARHRPGARETGARSEFASGRLHGRQTFSYGTVSARMKLPNGSGLWPAFWLLGVSGWPSAGEIDVMENVGDPSWVNAALHGPGYSGNTPFVRRSGFGLDDDVTRWHVYEVTWTSSDVAFRVDGNEYYRVVRDDIARHGEPGAVLDSAKYVILNLALGGTYPSAVNGVRTPYLGLPQSTVQQIGAGGARVLVDWVRWTRPR